MERAKEGVERRQLLKIAGLTTLAGLSGLGCGSGDGLATLGVNPATAQPTETEFTPSPNFLTFQRGRLGQVVDMGDGRFRVTLEDVSLSLVIETLQGLSDLETVREFVDFFQERYGSTAAFGSLFYRDAQGTGVVFAARLSSPAVEGDSLTFVAEAAEALPGSFNLGDNKLAATLSGGSLQSVGAPVGEVSLLVQAKEVSTSKQDLIVVEESTERRDCSVTKIEGPEVLDASRDGTIEFTGEAFFSVRKSDLAFVEIEIFAFPGPDNPRDLETLNERLKNEEKVLLFSSGPGPENNGPVIHEIRFYPLPDNGSPGRPESIVVAFERSGVVKQIRVCI